MSDPQYCMGLESAKLFPKVKKKSFSVLSCISIQTCTHSCMHVQVQTAHASQPQFTYNPNIYAYANYILTNKLTS